MRWIIVLAACSGSRDAKPPQPLAPSDATIDAAIDAPIDEAIVDAMPDAAVAALPAFPMGLLQGPFPSIEAYCKQAKPDDDKVRHCDEEKLGFKNKLARPAPPFEAARFFVVESRDPHCQLAIKVGGSWWVLEDAVRCLGDRAKSSLYQEVKTFEVSDLVPGDKPELVVRMKYEQSLEEYSPESFDRTKFEALVVCGVGASGAPDCSREIPISGTREEYAQGKKGKTTRFKLPITATPGRIDVIGDTSTIDSYLFAPLAAGSYTLVFR